jgi:hypothetical protein
VELLVPFDDGATLAAVHREGQVVSSEATEGGMRILARLDAASLGRLRDVVVDPDVLGAIMSDADDHDVDQQRGDIDA